MVNSKTFVQSAPEVNDPPFRETTDILFWLFQSHRLFSLLCSLPVKFDISKE
jgi:hypothetical protein